MNDCLRPLMGRPFPSREPWRFAPDDADDLVKKVRLKLRHDGREPKGKLLPATDVLLLIGRGGHRIGRFVRDILDGKIEPVSERRCPGFIGFSFLAEEVREYVSGLGVSEEAQRRQPRVWRLRARALGAMRSRDMRISSRHTLSGACARPMSIEASDLARVARQVLSRTTA